MNILVLDKNNKSWHVKDLMRAAGKNHRIETVDYSQACVQIPDASEKSKFGCSLSIDRIDCIFTRAMPAASLEQVVFRMDWLDQVARQNGVPVVNPAKTVEASVDKYLSLEKLRVAGVPVPVTAVSQTTEIALEQFHMFGSDTVLKPIFGSGGRDLRRLQNLQNAKEAFDLLQANGRVIYQQEYIEHGDSDLRLFVIGAQVFGMRRQRSGHWITNVSQGAETFFHQPSELEHDIAIRSSRSVGSHISGVDLVYDSTGAPYVVEINSCPSWKSLRSTAKVDIAAEIIRMIELQVEKKCSSI